MNVHAALQFWETPRALSASPSGEQNEILAVLVVDDALRILAMGSSRDFDLAGLHLVLGRVSTGDRQTDGQLRRHLAEGERKTIRLKRTGEAARLLSVLPIEPSAAGRNPRQAFLVLWIPPTSADNIPAVQAAFNLTAAETNVLRLIYRGLNTVEAARSLGVAVSTVRTHLYHIFGKTRTARQSELAYLVSTYSGPDTAPRDAWSPTVPNATPAGAVGE